MKGGCWWGGSGVKWKQRGRKWGISRLFGNLASVTPLETKCIFRRIFLQVVLGNFPCHESSLERDFSESFRRKTDVRRSL